MEERWIVEFMSLVRRKVNEPFATSHRW